MNETVRIEIPEPHYSVFDAMRDGLPEIITINSSLLSFAHNDVFPWYLIISIKAESLADKGMPTQEESKFLYEISDQLEKVALDGRTGAGSANALFLARSTWNGWRELIFYVHNPEIAHSALQIFLEKGSQKRYWEYHMEADADWTKAGYIFQLFAPPDAAKL